MFFPYFIKNPFCPLPSVLKISLMPVWGLYFIVNQNFILWKLEFSITGILKFYQRESRRSLFPFLSDIQKFLLILRQVCLQLRNILFYYVFKYCFYSISFETFFWLMMKLLYFLFHFSFVSFLSFNFVLYSKRIPWFCFQSHQIIYWLCPIWYSVYLLHLVLNQWFCLCFMNFENFFSTDICCCYCFCCCFLVDLIGFLMSSNIYLGVITTFILI